MFQLSPVMLSVLLLLLFNLWFFVPALPRVSAVTAVPTAADVSSAWCYQHFWLSVAGAPALVGVPAVVGFCHGVGTLALMVNLLLPTLLLLLKFLWLTILLFILSCSSSFTTKSDMLDNQTIGL
jgi:hypothetical protein